MTAHFFQIGEGAGSRVLEFGALTGRAVVDLTAQSGEIKTSLIPVGAVQGIQLIDKAEATEFYVRSAGTEDIRYLAVGEADRARLREYADAVERMLRRG